MKDIVSTNGKYYVVLNNNEMAYLSLGDNTIADVVKDKSWQEHCKPITNGDNTYYKYMPDVKSVFAK